MVEVTEIARARVAKLVSDWDWPDPAILEDILALGTDAVPVIDELLTPERLEAAQTDEQADTIVYYAMELLAALETPSAIPVFVNAYRHISDEMVEGMEQALLRLGPEAINPLLSVATDPALTWYGRALAANGAVHEAQQDPARREQVGEGLLALVAGYVARPEPLTDEEKDMVATLVSDLTDLVYAPAYPVIQAAFDADRVLSAPQGGFDIPIITREGFEKAYQEESHPRDWTPKPFLEEYRARRQRHLETEARLKLLDQETPPQPIVLGAKMGRNDLCWCGSGQKYKKCHLAQDEKEKVRL